MASKAKIIKGVGIAAVAAAAAAGAYYFYGGKSSAKHRKALKSWTVKIKGELMEKMEKLGHVTKERYERLVNEAIRKYKNVKSVDKAELEKLGRELRGHWHAISRAAASHSRKK